MYMRGSNSEVPQNGPATPVLADGARANTRDLRDGAREAKRSLIKDTIVGVPGVRFEVSGVGGFEEVMLNIFEDEDLSFQPFGDSVNIK
jgi:hypothetical protein